ncbi:hypothetical protein [Breoghania sp.]|uniref:hypothetical protein n=1 Tax=Breoghania sp. TaxID=2065378 RepID=UPI002636C83B|nr:hypothetical protein [Breoghania sp.]MDJ0930201.1 hypothetical protein [Breoghania sp.]
MSAPRIALNRQPGSSAEHARETALAFPAELSGESAGLVFDPLLAAASQDARCRPCPPTLLDADTRTQRRAALIRL